MTHTIQTNSLNAIANLKETLRLEELRLQLINDKISIFSEEEILSACKKIGVEILPDRIAAMSFPYVTGDATEESLRISNLMISYRVQGITFKPVVFKGFTKNGNSRNEAIRNNKAEKLEKRIKELTGYKCNINPYGMEVKTENEKFTFTIELYL